MPAVFLSWRLQPGRKWDGQVCVAPLSEFENEPLTAGSFSKAARTWLTQEVFLPKGDIVFPLKARYDQARYVLPPLLSPIASEPVPVSLSGMQHVSVDPQEEARPEEAVDEPTPCDDHADIDAADAQGAGPHFAIPPIEEGEIGIN